jgi:branched-chain amino acid transport system substrate-binding protein
MAKREKMISILVTTVLIICFTLVMLLPVSMAAEKGPIKIGFIAPQTGNFAQFGLDMISGAKMFLETKNYTVAGRKVEVIWEDEGGGPDTAVTKTRKLIKNDKVHLVAGVFMTSSAYAVAAVCTELKIPFFVPISGGDDLTQRQSSPYINRLSISGCDWGHVAGDYAYKELGWRKVVAIGMDYSVGYEAVGGFQDVFETLGGKVIQKIWAPMNTMDFGPFIASMDPELDGIYNMVSGAMGIRFLKSKQESGIMSKKGVMAAGTVTDETFLPALGDTALGVLTAHNYSATLENPKNKELRELCKRKLGKDSNWGIASSWVGIDWVLRAIQNINGDVENQDKFMKALRAVQMEDSIRGPLRMDEYGHPIQDFYVRRVDKAATGYQNTVIKTYPKVSQFWTWDAKTYLSKPVYNRDYPPCKFCK